MSDQTNNQERIDNCGLVKMLLMLSVVLCHSVSFFGGNWFVAYTPQQKVKALSVLSGYTGSFHVYCFTLVSGYLFYFLRIELKKYQSYKDFIYNKVKRLIVPYIFVSIIWVVPVSWLFFRFSVKEIIKNFVLCIYPSQLWFLWMLFWVFAIFWLVEKCFHEKDCFRLSICLLLFALGSAGKHFTPDLFNFLTACQYVVFFEAGYSIRKYDERINHILLLCISSIIHISLFISRYIISLPRIVDTVELFVLHLSGAIVAFEAFQYIAKKVQIDNRLIKTLIVYSMPIYLFHQQFIYIVIALTNNSLNPYIIAILAFFISIIASVATSKLLMRTKYGSFLIGVRE